MKKWMAVAISAVCAWIGVQSPAFASTIYTVKKGDTLSKIAAANGSSVESIAQENHITNPNYITVGEHLSIPDSTNTKATAIVATAKSLVGKYPYVWGGDSPSAGGFDCSGFIEYIYSQNGIELPRTAHEQADIGRYVPADQLQVGDLVFFVNTYSNNYGNGVTHVGIYIGNNQMIVQSSSKNTATIATLWGNPYWEAHYYGAKRVIN